MDNNLKTVFDPVPQVIEKNAPAMMARMVGRLKAQLEGATVADGSHALLFLKVGENDMVQAFEPLAPVSFTLDRLETNPRFAAIARPASSLPASENAPTISSGFAGLCDSTTFDVVSGGSLSIPYGAAAPCCGLVLASSGPRNLIAG